MSFETGDFLAHYGIKGMKWGRRKTSAPSSRSTEKSERRAKTRSKVKKGAVVTVGVLATVGAVSMSVASSRNQRTDRNVANLLSTVLTVDDIYGRSTYNSPEALKLLRG